MVTATAVVGVAYATATVAQQEDEDDDPAHIATAEAIVIHNEYLRKFTCDFRRSFQGIPKPKKCYTGNYISLVGAIINRPRAWSEGVWILR